MLQTWTAYSTNASQEVNLSACSPGLSLTYGLETFNALQINFHSPSEHTIGGGYYPAEVHIVHQNALTGGLLVLAILLDVAVVPVNNNTVLSTILSQNINNQQDFVPIYIQDNVTINPYGLLPGSTTRYAYLGSLTTPPCTEGVQWVIFEQPVRISWQDYEVIRAIIRASPNTIVSERGDNNRVPTASLNGRQVFRLVDANVFGTDGHVNYYDDDDDKDTGFAPQVVTGGSLAVAAVIILAVFVLLLISSMTMKKLYNCVPSTSLSPAVAATGVKDL